MPVLTPQVLTPLVLAASVLAPTVVGAPDASVEVTMPPLSYELSEEVMRDQGRLGPHVAGHYWLLGDDHYVYYIHDGVGWDPGDHDTALAGRTGIEVTLGSGNRTAAQVATATATAIDAVDGLTASPTDDSLTVGGVSTAEAGPRTWEDVGDQGIVGMRQVGVLAANNFGSDTLRASRIDPTALPSDPILVTGFRVRVANTHSAQLTVAIYQGGAGTGDFDGATLVGVVGTTTGSSTDTTLYVPTTTPFELDPTAGAVWVAWMHSTGGYTSSFTPVGGADGSASTFAADSGDGIFVMTSGPASSDSGDFPAALGTVASTFTSYPSIAISFVEAEGHACDMRPVVRLGTRTADPADFNQSTGPSGDTLLVGNSFTSPDVAGLYLIRRGMAYGTHATDSHYAQGFATGGTSDTNMSGATHTYLGLADGTGTGWQDYDITPGTVAVPASTRCWLTLRFDASGSTLLYQDDAATPDGYAEAGSNPAAYMTGGGVAPFPESEFDDGTLGGTATTNVDFDPDVALNGVVTPDGDNYTNQNGVGQRAWAAVIGFSVAA